MPAVVKDDRRGARERLLEAASRLFYAEGVHTVGIDRIIDEAGVAKASLYKTFGSKDALIQAYLQGRHDGVTRRISAAVARVDDPREKVLTVFEAQGTMFAEPGYRGCAFVAATAEASPTGTIDDAATAFRAWMRALFVGLATAAGAPDPATLGRRLHLLYDGASLSARMDRDPTVAADARAAAETLLDAALAGLTGPRVGSVLS
ncbi:TetR/AcrR family transcriptional regulator [Pseudofrankia inefficax]|uniref:Regulatory protein TetR n=1 Tax=Pseudofrankia inefficax (strain DSM 45817 / CECT 9037 / DDB 130130 / EuI1c) TaxID=298654 RepID=E3J8R9_PSEI1|nr:TetR/AcrR family transcriptional regulator [Pseudofrankia inefficax]ADP79652.1 regulatory protein TetR [Pseudofrankia inefficax]